MKMMNVLNKKLNKKGFTLAELLVVVAIIAILVAVSIPIFTSKLEASREATDAANERAAKAAAVTDFINGTQAADATYYYDAENGVVTTTNSGITGYGKGTTAGKVGTAHTDQIVEVKVTAGAAATSTTAETDPTVEIKWVAAGA